MDFSEIEKLFYIISEFFHDDPGEIEIEPVENIKGGGKICRIYLDGVEEASVPLMYRNAEGICEALDDKFVSPLVVVPFAEDRGGKKVLIGRNFEIAELEDRSLDLSKVVVAPMYYLYIASELFRAALGGRWRDFEIKASKVFGKESSVFFHHSNEKRALFYKGKLFEKFDPLNPFEEYFMKHKLVFPREKVDEGYRLPNDTHIGRVDPYETPESEKIGIILTTLEGAYDPENLALKKTEKILGKSTSFIPFIRHSDGARIEMGSKNLKQALIVNGAEKPLIGPDEKVGVNALVAYSLYYGYNFEDGIVVSRSFAEKMKAVLKEERKIEFEAPIAKNIEEIEEGNKKIFKFSWKASKGKDFSESTFEFNLGEHKAPKVGVARYISKDVSGKLNIKVPTSYKFTLENVEISDFYNIRKNFKKNENLEDVIGRIAFKIKMRVEKPLMVGDKLTGRHGNKGIVSKIIPDENMPKVFVNGEWKTVDIVMSPLSVVSRMNLSQLYETAASLLKKYGMWDFEKTPEKMEKEDREKVLENLKKLGADDYGRFRMILKRPAELGKIEEKEIRVFAGYQYIIRLDHNVKDKFHAIGGDLDYIKKALKVEESPIKQIDGGAAISFNPLTLQPNKGKRRGGGQKIGEMEFWTLLDHGAYETLRLFEERNIRGFNEVVGLTHLDFINVSLRYFNKKSSVLSVKASDIGIKTEANPSGSVRKVKLWENIIKSMKNLKEGVEKISKKKSEAHAKILLGKDGYIRNVAISRRLYNSARMVIVPRPDLDVDEILLPKELKKLWNIEKGDYILINRQPSLHRHSIQAFRVRGFWNEYALGFPILACEGFNADFDGDTVAVYYPEQTEEILKELKRMTPKAVPFKQGSGDLAWSISQDFKCHGLSKDEISEMIKDRNLDSQIFKEALTGATEEGLTLSLYEIEKDAESFKKIKERKCRGNEKQWKQLREKISENIGENFLDGVSEETFLSYLPRRSRKSLMDKKLHVAEAGYFTRKLVERLGSYLVLKKMGNEGILRYDREWLNKVKSYLKKEEKWKDFLRLALSGRYSPSGEIIEISPIRDYEILSPISGEITELSLGIDPANGGKWNTKYIGILSGHTIGEKGTQLSMETFHTGGTGVPFSMSKIESFIFKALKKSSNKYNPSDGFKIFLEYMMGMRSIRNLSEDISKMLGGNSNLLEFFKIHFVYFEILFRSAIDGLKINSWEDRGILTILSFERGKELLKKLKNGKISGKFDEKHPRTWYFFKGVV